MVIVCSDSLVLKRVYTLWLDSMLPESNALVDVDIIIDPEQEVSSVACVDGGYYVVTLPLPESVEEFGVQVLHSVMDTSGKITGVGIPRSESIRGIFMEDLLSIAHFSAQNYEAIKRVYSKS